MSLRVPLALVGALVAGVVISFGQTFSPDVLAPLFNSAAPVVALAAAVSMAARAVWARMVMGATAGPLAMVGYYATSALRGYGVSTSMVLMWCTAGVIAGAAMGFALWTLRHSDSWPLRAVSAAVFPGVALGEAGHGLLRVADTTPVAYWWSAAAAGVGVLTWLSLTRLRTMPGILLACATTAVFAGALFFIYGVA
ncbi:DUF6518 family protein [Demequina aestuarii]|uniref:DUF6518 family protein n=1 Tax=Demequina aestuarii TaxID=327095 RepID=UPI0007846698|nr:DUF6518 family protein [Demequina aestuarii]